MITTIHGLGHVAHFRDRPAEYTAIPTGRPDLARVFPDMAKAHNYLVAIRPVAASNPPPRRPSPVAKGKFQFQ